MDLAERLRRLGYGTPPPPPVAPRRGPDIDELLDGEWRETTHGRCFVATKRYPLAHVHGGVPLGRAAELRESSLALLARRGGLGGLGLEQAIFLDTETTGLAGGTGTYVFLVGVGRFTADAFVVEQYFMRDHGEERAMLATLVERMAPYPLVVSFNGKTFDWPLLQTRYLMAQQRLEPADPLHLDVLFPARRLWRERLGSCSLGSLEQGVLGVRRTFDVPGWLIPSIYLEAVRERDLRPLMPVFAHNEQDILSLLALTIVAARHVEDPVAEARDAVDVYSTGRVFESIAAWEEAILCYERALAGNLPGRLREQVLCRLGLVYKRVKHLGNAERVWRWLVGRPDCTGILPYVELAKHLEHRERDYAEAAEVTERALVLLARRPFDRFAYNRATEREHEELERRLARLRRKQAAQAIKE